MVKKGIPLVPEALRTTPRLIPDSQALNSLESTPLLTIDYHNHAACTLLLQSRIQESVGKLQAPNTPRYRSYLYTFRPKVGTTNIAGKELLSPTYHMYIGFWELIPSCVVGTSGKRIMDSPTTPFIYQPPVISCLLTSLNWPHTSSIKGTPWGL